MAVCCIVCLWLSLVLGPVNNREVKGQLKEGVEGRDEGGKGKERAPGLHCIAVVLRGNMKSAVHPHLVQHGIQEGTLTPMECDVWNVLYVLWNVTVECDVTGSLHHVDGKRVSVS